MKWFIIDQRKIGIIGLVICILCSFAFLAPQSVAEADQAAFVAYQSILMPFIVFFLFCLFKLCKIGLLEAVLCAVYLIINPFIRTEAAKHTVDTIFAIAAWAAIIVPLAVLFIRRKRG